MATLPDTCYYCNKDPELYPHMGLPPHTHRFTTDEKLVVGSTEILEEKYWPFNYSPDPEGPGFYTCCHLCEAPTIQFSYAKLLSNIEQDGWNKGSIDLSVRDEYLKSDEAKNVNFITRLNLLERKDYTPYCGSESCNMGSPRTTMKHSQFVCRCGWKSDFDSQFINAYNSRWNNYKVDEKVVFISATDNRLYSIVSPVYREDSDSHEMVVVIPQVGAFGVNRNPSEDEGPTHVLADSLRYPTETELKTGVRSLLLDRGWTSHTSRLVFSSPKKFLIKSKSPKVPKHKKFKNKTTNFLMSKLK